MNSRSRIQPRMPAKQFELVAKALADPRRMALLEAIGAEKECPCQRLCREFPVSKGTVSHHMKELERAGLILSRREGQYTHFEICREALTAYSAELLRRVSNPR